MKRQRAQLLSEANRREHLIHCKQLLKQFLDHVIDFLWFSDEKVFTPFNSQNDRLYAPISTKKGSIASSRLLRTRSAFTRSVKVSAAMSKIGVAGLFFVEPGVKVDGKYYSAPAHRARDTVELLQRETADFISPELWPPTVRT